MKITLNIYDIQRDTHVWQVNTNKEIYIVVLCTKQKNLKVSNLKLVQDIENKGNQTPSNKPNTNKKKIEKGKTRYQGQKFKGQGKWAWKKNSKKEMEGKINKSNGKNYQWCKYYAEWTLHDPKAYGESGCRKKHQMPQQNIKNLSYNVDNIVTTILKQL